MNRLSQAARAKSITRSARAHLAKIVVRRTRGCNPIIADLVFATRAQASRARPLVIDLTRRTGCMHLCCNSPWLKVMSSYNRRSLVRDIPLSSEEPKP